MHGRVQGVGFRWWTRSQALRLGLTGAVRNCEDGTVEVRARGPTAALTELRHLLASGPPRAEVRRIDEEPTAEIPEAGFKIDR